MSKNKNILNKKEQKANPKIEKSAQNKRFSLQTVFTGSFLEKDELIKQLPFILFVFALFIIYIANSYYAEKTVFKIEKYKSELIEFRSEYIAAKTRLMTGTNIGKVSDKLKGNGVSPSHIPPKKVFVKKTKNE